MIWKAPTYHISRLTTKVVTPRSSGKELGIPEGSPLTTPMVDMVLAVMRIMSGR